MCSHVNNCNNHHGQFVKLQNLHHRITNEAKRITSFAVTVVCERQVHSKDARIQFQLLANILHTQPTKCFSKEQFK